MRDLLLSALLLAAAPAVAATKPVEGVPRSQRHCVSYNYGDSIGPRDDSSVIVRRGARTSYLVRFLGGRCPFLNSQSTLIVERFGSGFLCPTDRIRAFNPPQTIPGPDCVIASIEPYTEPPRRKR